MLFTIIIPTYNRAAKTERAVRSVLEQSFSDFEILVIDDGSSDNTSERISTVNDARVKYHYKANEERSVARNYGALRAKGDYLIFLDSDDRMLPGHLERARDFIENSRPRPLFMFSEYVITDSDGKVLSHYRGSGIISPQRMSFGNDASCSPVIIGRELFLRHRFNEDPRLIMFEDWELWLRVMNEEPLHIIGGPGIRHENHDGRSVLSSTPEKYVQKVNYLSRHIPANVPLIHDNKILRKQFLAGLYSYAALHIALGAQGKVQALKYLLTALRHKPAFILQRRFLATLRRLP